MNEAIGAKTLTVIKAASRLHRRVTASDIAMATGFSLADAEYELTRLTSKVNGHLEVSKNGEIVYAFPRGFREAFMLSPIEARIRNVVSFTARSAWWTFKMYFGTTLVVSICLSFAVIIAVLARFVDGGDLGSFGSLGGSDKKKKEKISPVLETSTNLPAVTQDVVVTESKQLDNKQFAKYRDDYSLKLAELGQLEWTALEPSQRPGQTSKREDQATAFFTEVFSFLFADDNPNKLLKEERNSSIAQLILARHGVVIAEELAPFLDVGVDQLGDEKFVVPILAHFNGRAKVSENGHMVYIFEPANVSAVAGQSSVPIPHFLEERQWTLTYSWHVEALVIVNIVLAIMAVPFSLALSPIWFPLTAILLFNAFFYVVLNWVAKEKVSWQNRLVNCLNERRLECIQFLLDPVNLVELKLKEAAKFAPEQELISEADIVYRTDTDILEQAFERKPWIERADVIGSLALETSKQSTGSSDNQQSVDN